MMASPLHGHDTEARARWGDVEAHGVGPGAALPLRGRGVHRGAPVLAAPAMTGSPCHDAEALAMMDEVALLEQALREAVDRRRTGTGTDPGSPRGKTFDTALATYAVQLRAWIDMQVDSRLNQVLPGLIEGEMAASREDASAAIEVAERSEAEIRAVADAQSKILALVEGFTREMERLKAAVAARQQQVALFQNAQVEHQASAFAREETLAALEKVRERLEELGRSSHDRVEELSRNVEDLSRSSRERFEELARGFSRENEGTVARFAQVEGAISELRRLDERQEAVRAALQRLQQEVRRMEAFERELSASSAARTEFEARLDARLEALRSEVAGAAGAKTELESCVKRASVEVDTRVESIIEARLEAWQFDSKLESRLGGLRAELEERLDSQSRVRLEALRLESKQDFTTQLGETQDRIESQFRMCLEALRLEGRQELRDHIHETQERIESGFKRSLEAIRTDSKEDCKGQIDKSHARLGEDLVALQQRLVTELRAETTAALSRESAAIAALDEQLWITDQRLGQRIDELSHMHLRRAAAPERLGGAEILGVGGVAGKQHQAQEEERIAELRRENSTPRRDGAMTPPPHRSSSLSLGVSGLFDGAGFGGGLAAAGLAGRALMEAARAGDANTSAEEQDSRNRSGVDSGPSAASITAAAPAATRPEPLVRTEPSVRTAGSAREGLRLSPPEGPRLSPRSASLRLYGDAWRGTEAGAARRSPSNGAGNTAAAVAALAARVERRELKEMQARQRHSHSGVLSVASQAAEELTDAARR